MGLDRAVPARFARGCGLHAAQRATSRKGASAASLSRRDRLAAAASIRVASVTGDGSLLQVPAGPFKKLLLTSDRIEGAMRARLNIPWPRGADQASCLLTSRRPAFSPPNPSGTQNCTTTRSLILWAARHANFVVPTRERSSWAQKCADLSLMSPGDSLSYPDSSNQ